MHHPDQVVLDLRNPKMKPAATVEQVVRNVKMWCMVNVMASSSSDLTPHQKAAYDAASDAAARLGHPLPHSMLMVIATKGAGVSELLASQKGSVVDAN